MKRLTLLVSLLVSLCACASGSKPYTPPKLPYHSWYIGLAAPRHMEVWVETVDVLDNRGGAYFEVHSGRASYARTPQNWPYAGTMMPVNNVDLPQRIFLRWQSLVEPQSYKIRIPIPQWVRDEMLRPERVFCQGSKEWRNDYRKMITLGMAPGGIVKVWMGGACLDSKEVGRFQAEIEPLGPFRGKSKGQYIRIEPENKAYVEQQGIPYGSW
ncbi:DUF2931 family protein [Pseudomonas putida]|uniref:DUF2931 family protein n=1 Tax=Pseudomonas putida TaxID=303 RepID=UPI003D9937DC